MIRYRRVCTFCGFKGDVMSPQFGKAQYEAKGLRDCPDCEDESTFKVGKIVNGTHPGAKGITVMELQVLCHLALDGLTFKEIDAMYGYKRKSPRYGGRAASTIYRIRRRLGAKTTQHLIALAYQRGILEI